MNKLAVFGMFAVLFGARMIFGFDSIRKEGVWPETWPVELEHLRKQARSVTGGLANLTRYEIHFTTRDEFESAWPHLLNVKTAGAPVVLLAKPRKTDGERFSAQVRIRCPPSHLKDNAKPAVPVPGTTDIRERWLWTTYIELQVDGEIVDLNRIPLPAETPIIDLRFKDAEGKSSK